MTKVGQRLLAAGTVLLLAGPVSQVLWAEVRPDPMLSIDHNRPVVTERIVESFRPAFGPGQEATVRTALAGMRADHLLAASLAPSLDGLLAVLKSADAATSVVLAKPVGKALGEVAEDVVYTPVTPCRIVDTRSGAGGTLAAGDARSWLAANPTGTFVTQGGQRYQLRDSGEAGGGAGELDGGQCAEWAGVPDGVAVQSSEALGGVAELGGGWDADCERDHPAAVHGGWVHVGLEPVLEQRDRADRRRDGVLRGADGRVCHRQLPGGQGSAQRQS